MINRVIAFIDGFNLYHSIDNLDKDPHTKKHLNKKHYLKWLNIWLLTQALIHPKNDQLDQVLYFSAYANWLPEAKERHKLYVRALESTGVITVMGQFKRKPRSCPECRHKWYSYEEEESDVNLAVQLVQLAHQNLFDKAIVFSADTDLVPSIKSVRSCFPEKEVWIAMPKDRAKHSNALKAAATCTIRLCEHHFKNNSFENRLLDKHNRIIQKPEKYQRF